MTKTAGLLLGLILFCTMASCAEWDDLSTTDAIICECLSNRLALMGESPSEEFSEMAFDIWDTSDACALLTQAIAGQWQGLGNASHLRYVFNPNGTYALKSPQHDTWRNIQTGKFWIEYGIHQGMYRAELHMTLPDADDYPTRFYVTGDNLVFEEDMGTAERIAFKKLP